MHVLGVLLQWLLTLLNKEQNNTFALYCTQIVGVFQSWPCRGESPDPAKLLVLL